MARISKYREETDADRLARYTRIIQAFELAGLPTTQKEIGQTLRPKIGQGAVSAWKRVNPSLGHLAQICRLTNVSGHWLLLGEGPIHAPGQAVATAENFLQGVIDQLSPEARDALLERIGSRRDRDRSK